MNVLRQSASNEIVLELGLSVEEYPMFTLHFFQNGTEVLTKELADCEVEGNVLRLRLRQDETAHLSPQRFAIELVAAKAAEGETVVSEEITGIVARSLTK